VPFKGDYHGTKNNCNGWADSAADACGIKCELNVAKHGQ